MIRGCAHVNVSLSFGTQADKHKQTAAEAKTSVPYSFCLFTGKQMQAKRSRLRVTSRKTKRGDWDDDEAAIRCVYRDWVATVLLPAVQHP